MEITYLRHNEINKYKWDKCISNAFNGIIYAYSWYLDIVCENWEALVQGDYYRVMPLTPSVKYRIPYLHQPLLSQQLGVISTLLLSPEIINDFLNKLPEKYKFAEINLNIFNIVENDNFTITYNTTYELDLIRDIKSLRSNYSTNTKRNLKKAEDCKVSLHTNNLQINQILEFYDEATKTLQYKNCDTLRKIIAITTLHKLGYIYSAYTVENSLCAIAFFVRSHNKNIYLLGVSNELGYENKAMFTIIDKFIENNSEQNMILDFEGSNLPGVARFYRGFGAKACKYPTVKRNKLPWYIKIFKK